MKKTSLTSTEAQILSRTVSDCSVQSEISRTPVAACKTGQRGAAPASADQSTNEHEAAWPFVIALLLITLFALGVFVAKLYFGIRL
jgi:hypothetical protein